MNSSRGRYAAVMRPRRSKRQPSSVPDDETLQRHAALTENGRALLDSCRAMVAEEVD
jgi:hypothetical protein